MNVSAMLRWLVLCLSIGAASVHAVTCINTMIPAGNPDAAYTEPNPPDGTVTDTRTGLMWKKCSEGQTWSGSTCTGTAGWYNWSGALGLAAASSFAGHTDWRPPNIRELRSLVEECRISPAINDTVFPNTPSSLFWSGSPDAVTSNGAWYVDFGDGHDYRFNRSADFNYSVRLVRGGQIFDSFDLLAATSISPSDCLFNWAEKTYPTLFAPAGVVSQTQAPYYYRYYSQTDAYLGTSSADNHVYYKGPASNNSIVDEGALTTWLPTAGCQ